MKNRLVYIVFVLAALFLTACAPVKWGYQLNSPAKLQWPPPPSPVKIVYDGTLSAFKPTGESMFTRIFGRGDSGQIIKPVAVAVGSDGRLAIADAALTGVHLYIPSEQRYMLLTHAGKLRLKSPVSVIFGADLRLYVSDSTWRQIFVFDQRGDFVQGISATGNTTLKRPTGLTIRPDNNLLYVTDTTAHRLEIFDKQGNYRGHIGERGKEPGEFNFPTHIASDAQGRIYVNDAMNFRVQVFSPRNKVLAVFGHHGNGSGDFAMSKGIAVDRKGIIYVVDTLFDRVQLFDIRGEYLLSFGGRGTGPGEFWLPSGIFIDHKTQKLYVCDTYNKRIQIYTLHD